MPIKQLNPYLNFNGTAEKAMKLYESALGAKAQDVSRYGDAPGMDLPAEHQNWVMHAVIRLGDATIMLGDVMPNTPAKVGDNVSVTLHFDDTSDMAKKFDALAVGGQVTMPLQDTFWGARFGTLTDAYGVSWMFNCELKKS
jgi:PhnB protein